MLSKKLILTGLVLILPTVLGAAPVLIEVDLENRASFRLAKSLGISPWARWDNAFLAEIDSDKLAFLTESHIPYRIISGNPKSQPGYIISPELKAPVALTSGLSDKKVLSRPDLWFDQRSDKEAESLHHQGFILYPVGDRPIPLTYLERPKVVFPSGGQLDTIQYLVDQIVTDSLSSYVLRLEDFVTRYSYSDSVAPARQWILDKFSSFGIDSVYLDHFYWNSDQWNVVATVPGTAEPDRTIVVGGHYDSVTYNQAPGPADFAPGADDNGSGTAATLELARIISSNPLPYTVVFIAFGQEEQGLRGGYAYAAQAASNGDDIRFMLNMDMIAYKPNDTQVKLLHNATSEPVADLMDSLAAVYAGLDGVKGSAAANSDHWPFMQQGYLSVFAHEYVFNSQGWHKNTDLSDSMNFDYMTKVTKLGMATIAALSQPNCLALPGDVNGNTQISLEDVIHTVNFLFNKPGGPWTIDPVCRGDVNANGAITLGDIIFLANYVLGKPGDWAPYSSGDCCLN